MNNSPLVSFCIFSYNQENFITDALEGAVSQDYDNLEIIVSDDCSTDNTPQIIDNFVSNYKGKHQIIVNKNEHNMGIAKHVCKILYEKAKGDILVVAAGDDKSLPNRTSMTVEYFNRFPEISSLSFLTQPVEKDMSMGTPYSHLTFRPHSFSIFNLDDYLKLNMGLYSGDSRALRRSVINAFPPLKIAPAEDYFLYLRSLMIGNIAYIREPVLLRRHHDSNVSAMVPKKSRYKKNRLQFREDIIWALDHNYIDERISQKLLERTKTITRYSYKKVIKTILYNKLRNNKIVRMLYWKMHS